MNIEDAWVCVYLKPGYWETGALRRYFIANSPNEGELTTFFLSRNCAYEESINFFKFKIPTLQDALVLDEVYIPREFVLAVGVAHGKESRQEDPRRIGFVLGPTANGR